MCWQPRCGKKATHSYGIEVDGKKIATKAFCKRHAKQYQKSQGGFIWITKQGE